MMLYRNLIAASCVMFTIGIASIHLVNVSIPTNKYLNPPCALGKKPTMSIPEGPREATGGGGGEWELNQILLQESAYVPSLNPNSKTLQEGDEHTNQQRRSDPLKVTNAAEKEWDQSNTRIANSVKTVHGHWTETLGQTMSGVGLDNVREFRTLYVLRSLEMRFLPKLCPFLPNLDS
jgi:hypothetical protein